MMIREKRRLDEASTEILDLPTSIMMDILLRQPIQTVFSCRNVCQSWKNIVSDPYFTRMCTGKLHMANFALSISRENIASLWKLCKFGLCVKKKKEIALPLSTKGQLFILGSCNGLVCLRHKFFDNIDDLYLWNPALGENILLPRSKNEKRILKSAYGYGLSQYTGHYKVLRIVHKSYLYRPNKTEGEVITIGIDNKWRDIGSAPFPLHENFCKVTLNGALHWIIDDFRKPDFIYSFNIDKENVQIIAPPRDLVDRRPWMSLAVFDNILCILDNSRDSELEIWLMKEYGVAESWNKYLRMEKAQVQYQSLLLPANIWRDKELYVIKFYQFVYALNPNQRKFFEVEVLENKSRFLRNTVSDSVAAYNVSLLSPKDVMGTNLS
ncbi:F-box protein [Abeliophyllum distichum]|uniref:F-box protein n=1 Tax=Abeliophyllum distichum TaxID=126358 RepID=A0ABD1U181_9LAMI